MLNISSRTMRLNQDYKGKSKEKDGEITKLLTFGLDEIEVDEREFGAITGEPHGARAIVNSTKNGPRPMFKCFKPYQLDEDIENAAVTIRLRGGTEFKFTGCKVSKIRFKVDDTGTILLSCKVCTAPALDARHAEFIAASGELIDGELNGSSASDQKDLPLNKHSEGEQTEEKPRGRGKRNGTQPAAH